MSAENPNYSIVTIDLHKTYFAGASEIEVLKGISLNVEKGSFVALCGPSGSGKTTLLNLISGIDRPTSGQILVLSQNLNEFDEDQMPEFRCNELGFVFQSYNLVSTLSVAENVAFPMEWRRRPEEEIVERVTDLLDMVGLAHRANHFPAQLSGGEQQRVAFARALANDPRLFLADEPTGNLDTKNGRKIIEMLQILKSSGKTVVVSTHDTEIVRLADLTVCLEDGKLVSQNE
jgi:putative ABC transport system ATP-binding protein